MLAFLSGEGPEKLLVWREETSLPARPHPWPCSILILSPSSHMQHPMACISHRIFWGKHHLKAGEGAEGAGSR